MKQDVNTLWKILRIVFVIFSLYLMGDVFRRWDGAQYYASIADFLPSVALVYILWTLLAVCISFLIWITAKLISIIIRFIKVEDLLILFISASVLASLLYAGKSVFKNIEITNIVKILLLFFIAAAALIPTWLLHKKSEKLFISINSQITPLVWLFSMLFVFSIPLVAYKTMGTKQATGLSVQKKETMRGDEKRPNVLLITFDALTARDMSAYGYNRPTTPFIEEWSKSGSLFSRVKSESTYTTPTTSSLMTGKRVWTHQTYFVEVTSKYVGGNNENLPYFLKRYGYSNVAIQQIHQASVRKLGLAKYFDVIVGPDQLSYSPLLHKHIGKFLYRIFGRKIILYDWIIKEDFILFKLLNKITSDAAVTAQRPERAFDKFIETYDNGLKEPYFAWIHIFAPHDPYLPPQPFKGMFNASKELRTWKSQNRSGTLDKINVFRDRYDEFIRYDDEQFKKFIIQLEKRNITENTVIILSADHGESFAHNFKGHGGSHLYEDLTHIPLIIKEPNNPGGLVINNLTEQVDITPTILDLAKIPIPPWMEGRSLVPLLRGKNLLPKQALSMSLVNNPGRGHEITSGTIAIWDGDYKLIYYLNDEESLLFNLKDDPYEVNNLIDVQSDIGNHLLAAIKNNLDSANKRIKDQR